MSGSTPVFTATDNVILPVLALRDQCLFPEASLTHVVDRPAGFACLEIAARGGRRLVAVAQRDPNLDSPTTRDLQAVGTIAYVADHEPTPKGDRRVELDGLRRARLVTVVGLDTMFAELQPLEEGDPGDEWGPAVEALARYLHAHAELRSFLEEQRRSKEPMSWVNLACQHLPITATARQRLLESDAPERCLKISRGLDALLRKEHKEPVS